MITPLSFSGGAGGSAASGLNTSGASYGMGMGDWTVNVGGSGNGSASGNTTGRAGLSMLQLAILGLAALWIIRSTK